MATVAPNLPRTGDAVTVKGIDRWIFVAMALWFIAIVLVGFIPDSQMKIALIAAGQRPAFPLVAHLHALCMGSFLVLLLAQSTLMATGRGAYHRQLGVAAFVLVPVLVLVGFLLVRTNYALLLGMAADAPPDGKAEVAGMLNVWENIMLLQIRIGLLFAIYMTIALRARKRDSGLHKRMMFLAIAPALPAAFDRMTWLPNTMPTSPLGPDLWVLFAIAPMFLWDVVRNARVHRAYWIWLLVAAPFTVFVHTMWDTPWWHAMVRSMMGA
ncbi:hypothetical protein [Sphingomicrobium nitratireducens]|uniref:hypothetical protein n=1 Tax=Sphingomicrobium nitratireducens TaxID=2964666 RepID=UPI00223F8B50|nr:hypothetical protein [Sphingomicrobium nitratireducens]